MRFTDIRPETIDEILGHELEKASIKAIIHRAETSNDLPHFLFIGATPGTGKTTMATAMAIQIWGKDWENHFKELNASDDRGIAVVRNEIKRIASHVGERILFLTEADHLTSDAQHALRRIMEKSRGTVFILDGNIMERIIPAIQSRCAIYIFGPLDPKDVLKGVLQACKKMDITLDLKNEKVKEGLVLLAKQSGGDLRRALNDLEKVVNMDREITPESLMLIRKPPNLTLALNKAIEGDWVGAKEMVTNAYIEVGYDAGPVIDSLYDALEGVANEEVAKRLYSKLGEIQRGCSSVSGSNNAVSKLLIQLVDFISFASVAPRMMRCPAVEREG